MRKGGVRGVLKWTATSWIIRQQGWPPSPLLRKVKLKVATLELRFAISHSKKHEMLVPIGTHTDTPISNGSSMFNNVYHHHVRTSCLTVHIMGHPMASPDPDRPYLQERPQHRSPKGSPPLLTPHAWPAKQRSPQRRSWLWTAME